VNPLTTLPIEVSTIDKAMAFRRAGDWGAAAATWRDVIEAADGKANPNWLLRAAEACARAGRSDEAGAWVEAIPVTAHVEADAALYGASALLDVGMIAEAAKALAFAGPPNSTNAWACALNARLLLAKGHINAARALAAQIAIMPDSDGRSQRILKQSGLLDPTGAETRSSFAFPSAAIDPMESVAAGGPASVAYNNAPGVEPDTSAFEAGKHADAHLRIVIEGCLPARAEELEVRSFLAIGEKALSAGAYENAKSQFVSAMMLAPKSSQAAHGLARVADRLGDSVGHLKWLQEAVNLDPTASGLRRNLARLLTRLGQHDRALVEWQILHANLPGEIEPLVQVARSLQKLDQHVAALQAFDLLIEMNATHLNGAIGRARSLQALGHPGAVEGWRRVLMLDPASEEGAIAVSAALNDQGQHREAIMVLDSVAQHRPESHRLRLQMARIFMAADDPARAIPILSTLSVEQPDLISPYVQLGRAHHKLGNQESALAMWERTLELDPDHSEALLRVSAIYEATQRPDDAVALWKARLGDEQSARQALLQLARINHRRNRPTDATHYFQLAAEAAPSDVRVIGEAARYLARFQSTLYEAEALTSRWMSLSPDEPDALVCRSGILLRTDRHVESDADLKKALEIAPTSVSALSTRTRRLYAQERWAEAEAFARRWRDATGNGPDATDSLARILSKQGLRAEAETLYRDQLAADPKDIRAVIAVAEFFRRDHQLDEALRLWREALVLDPACIPAWTELVVTLAMSDREAEALEAFGQAQERIGTGADAQLRSAIMLDRSRFIHKADAAYNAAIEVAPDSTAALLAYGRFLVDEGRLSEALKMLHRTRESDPGNWELALELIEVIESLTLIGHEDPIKVLKGPDLGNVMPEALFDLVIEAARHIEVYDPKPRLIALVTRSMGPGGAERQLAATASGLAESPHASGLFLSCLPLEAKLKNDFYAPVIRAAGVPIIEAEPQDVLESNEDLAVLKYQYILRRLPRDMGPVGWWLAQFRRMRPEVVHIWQDMTNLSVSIAAVLAGVPRIILGTRSVRPDNQRRRLRRWMKHGYQQLLSLPNIKMINNSRAGATDYADWLDIAPESINVVYNGLDFAAFHGELEAIDGNAVRAELGVPPAAPLIGGVFRMSEEKRPMLWMETAAKVASERLDAHFVVCGNGQFYQEMRAYAEDHDFGDRMHLPGVKSEIGAWFKAMDVVLLTSRHEGLPNVLIEAQSLGIPVVAPSVGGVPEALIDGETGFAIHAATADSLAEKLLFILGDADWRVRAKMASPTFISNKFSMQRMIANTLEIYFSDNGATGDALRAKQLPIQQPG
jgi:tetratricopeptide (TPR) repeat protein/glycosyltransferase involved in cell wall biosynthesis